MKALAFNGSPRANGNTHRALEIVLEEIEKKGIEVELVQMGGEDISPCKACGTCGKKKNERCIIKDDPVNEYIQMIKGADAVIIGSPTYFGGLSAQTKAFIDRVGYVARANDGLFRHKVGAAVAVHRRAGSLNTFDEINHFFLIGEWIIPGASYWNVVTAHKRGDIEQDAEGVKTMRNLGQNIAWLVKKLK